MLLLFLAISSSFLLANGAGLFVIGDEMPAGLIFFVFFLGALNYYNSTRLLDLSKDCGPTRRCPTVLIFAGEQSGTLELIVTFFCLFSFRIATLVNFIFS